MRLAALGHKVSEETKHKMRLALSGEKNYGWKGDKVGCRCLHKWIRKYLPAPEICDNCRENKKLDLANTGIYNRDFNNWKYLCRKCHMLSDGRLNNLKHN